MEEKEKIDQKEISVNKKLNTKKTVDEKVKENEHKAKVLNSDAENKVCRYYGWSAYLLFFIPLIFNSKNKAVRFHVNQGFWLNITEICTALFTWLFFLAYNSATLPEWFKSICFVLFILSCLFISLLVMTAFYLIFLCIAQNGKEIKPLNKIKVFNKE